MLAMFMQVLDTSICIVALPYMQGSLSASAEEINWVLTSSVIAAAIRRDVDLRPISAPIFFSPITRP